jgi:tetratricopeptide (TPR) repeat protein
MAVSGLQLFPESAMQHWLEHPWHQEIADFKLPEKELLSLHAACVTTSRYLGPEQAQGGVYTADGDYVSSSRHLRRSKDLTASNPQAIRLSNDMPRLSGRYLYLGWFFNHYGHFILESLARAWAVQELSLVDGYIMHVHAVDARPASYLLDFFDLLAIPSDKLVFANKDIQVDELLLPSQQAVLSRGMSEDMRRLYHQLGSKAAQQKNRDSATSSKLYLSRRFLPVDQRSASNEKALEERFQTEGYQVVHPQFLDVKSQLAMYYVATDFAGLEGSGLHNVLFAKDPHGVWMLGARNHLADAITQVVLDEYCHCETELHLQSAPEFFCLHPRITPFLISPGDDRSSYLSGIGATTYDRFLWLSALADQLDRKGCPESDRVDTSGQMLETETELLCRLPVSSDDDGETYVGMSRDNEFYDFLTAERYFVQGRLALAIGQMERLLSSYEHHAAFLHRYAQMLAADGRDEEALEVATRALALDHMNPMLTVFHSALMIQLGHVDDAVLNLQELMKTFPRHFQAKVKLAEALAKMTQYQEAAEVLQAVIQDSGKHNGLFPRLTWYLLKCGHYEAAKVAAHKALEQVPGNPFSLLHLSRIHLALDEPEIALEWVERAIRHSPEKQDLYQLQQKIRQHL